MSGYEDNPYLGEAWHEKYLTTGREIQSNGYGNRLKLRLPASWSLSQNSSEHQVGHLTALCNLVLAARLQARLQALWDKGIWRCSSKPKKGIAWRHTQKKRAGLALFKLWLCWNHTWYEVAVWKSRQDWGHPKLCDRGWGADTCHFFTAEHLFSPSLYNQTKDCSCKRRDLHLHTRNGFPQQWLGSASPGTQLLFAWLQKEPFGQEFAASLIPCQSSPASFYILTRYWHGFPQGSWFLFYILGQSLTIINKQ